MPVAARQPTPADAPIPGEAPDAPMPPIPEMCDELKALVDGASYETVANAMGCHQGTLSRAINSRTMSDNLAAKAWTYLQEARLAAERGDIAPATLAATSVNRRVTTLCNYARRRHCWAMLIGESGAGKTTALKAYQAANPAAIYLDSGPHIKSTTKLVDAIWAASGFRLTSPSKRSGPNLAEKWDEIVARWTVADGQVSGRLLIVDNAHRLPFDTIDALCPLQEATGVGLVIAGTTRLSGRVSLAGDAHQLYEQIRRRVGISYTIGKPTARDVELVAEAWLPAKSKVAPAAMERLVELAQTLGNFGQVWRYLTAVQELPGEWKVTLPADRIERRHIDAAAALLEDV